MKTLIIVGMISLAFCAWGDNFQKCSINGASVTCGLETQGVGSTISTDTVGGKDAYKLYLPNVGGDFADLYMTGINAKLANTTGTFQAYVPGAANGGYASLQPYMYFTINPYGTDFSVDPYALVIVADSGFGNFVNDAWYQDGISLASKVHIVLANWTPAAAGITNLDWLTCCSDLPTLGQLLNVAIPMNPGSRTCTARHAAPAVHSAMPGHSRISPDIQRRGELRPICESYPSRRHAPPPIGDQAPSMAFTWRMTSKASATYRTSALPRAQPQPASRLMARR